MYTKQHITSFTNDHIIEKRKSYNVTYINRPIYARNNWVPLSAIIFCGVMFLITFIYYRFHADKYGRMSVPYPVSLTMLGIYSLFLAFTLALFLPMDEIKYSSIKIPAYMCVLFYLYHVILLLIIAAGTVCIVLVIDHARRAAITEKLHHKDDSSSSITRIPHSPYLRPIAIRAIILIIPLIVIQVTYLFLAVKIQKKITA